MNTCTPPAEVRMDVRESVVLGQRKEDSSWTTALTLTAETAVTDAPTGGALPFLRRQPR